MVLENMYSVQARHIMNEIYSNDKIIIVQADNVSFNVVLIMLKKDLASLRQLTKTLDHLANNNMWFSARY